MPFVLPCVDESYDFEPSPAPSDNHGFLDLPSSSLFLGPPSPFGGTPVPAEARRRRSPTPPRPSRPYSRAVPGETSASSLAPRFRSASAAAIGASDQRIGSGNLGTQSPGCFQRGCGHLSPVLHVQHDGQHGPQAERDCNLYGAPNAVLATCCNIRAGSHVACATWCEIRGAIDVIRAPSHSSPWHWQRCVSFLAQPLR